MYQCGDRVMYGIHGVCSVVALEERIMDRKRVEYYVLEPLDQKGARFYVPTQNKVAVDKLRTVLSREEINTLLRSDLVRRENWIPDEGQRKNRYRELIGSGDRVQLLQMVYTLHSHKQRQLEAGRKFHLCDENFLRDAEKLLSSEFSLALGIPQDEVGGYVRRALEE